MGSFFPVNSVKVRNIHSNGSGFVDIANNSKADEEMTSNDTVLVSNETETDLFANETTPQYVLMSQPLLTLNDSSSDLRRMSTLIHSDSNRTVKKTDLLSRVAKKTKMPMLTAETNTLAVGTSEVSSLKMQKEGARNSEGFSNLSSQTFVTKTANTVLEASSFTSFQLQSELEKPLTVPSSTTLMEMDELPTSKVQVGPAATPNGPSTTASQLTRTESEKVVRGVTRFSGLKSLPQTLSPSAAPFSVLLLNSVQLLSHIAETSPLVARDSSLSIMFGSNTTPGTDKLTNEHLLASGNEHRKTILNLSSSREKPHIPSSPLEPGVPTGILHLQSIVHTFSPEPSDSTDWLPDVSKQNQLPNKTGLFSDIANIVLPTESTASPEATSSLTSMLGMPTPRLPIVLSWHMPNSSFVMPLSRLETPKSPPEATTENGHNLSVFTESKNEEKQISEGTGTLMEVIATSPALSTRYVVSYTESFTIKKLSSSVFTNFMLNTTEKVSSFSDTLILSNGTQSVYQGRTFYVIVPTPPANPPVNTQGSSNIRTSELISQSSKTSKIQVERDQIPFITSRPEEMPSLSDVSPSGTNSSILFTITHSLNMVHSTVVASSEQNTQLLHRSFTVPVEQDEISIITPRLEGIPTLSDVFSKESRSSTSFADTTSARVVQSIIITSSGKNANPQSGGYSIQKERKEISAVSTISEEPSSTYTNASATDFLSSASFAGNNISSMVHVNVVSSSKGTARLSSPSKVREKNEDIFLTSRIDGLASLSDVSSKYVSTSTAFLYSSNPGVKHSNITTSSAENAQSSSSSRIQVERDQIPAVTPRLEGLPRLSDISPVETHYSTSLPDTDHPDIVQSTFVTSGQNVQSSSPSNIQEGRDEVTVLTSTQEGLPSLSSVSPKQMEQPADIKNVSVIYPTSGQYAHLSSSSRLQVHSNELRFMTPRLKESTTLMDLSPTAKYFSTFSTDGKNSSLVGATIAPSKIQEERDDVSFLTPTLEELSSLSDVSTRGMQSPVSYFQINSPVVGNENHVELSAAMLLFKPTLAQSKLPIQSSELEFSVVEGNIISAEINRTSAWSNTLLATPTTSASLMLSVDVTSLMEQATTTLLTRFHGNSSVLEPSPSQLNIPLVPSPPITGMASNRDSKHEVAVELSTESTPNPLRNKSGTMSHSNQHSEPSSLHFPHEYDVRTPALLNVPRQLQLSANSVIIGLKTPHDTEGKPSMKSTGNASFVARSHERRVDLEQSTDLAYSVYKDAANKENISAFARTALNAFYSSSTGSFITNPLTAKSEPLSKTLQETLGKVKAKENVVRVLASGIVSSPVFHLAVRYIGELLKNETSLVHSVSRIESTLDQLQRLVLHETNNQLRALGNNFSIPLNETVNKGNGSDEISKHVDLKFMGISTKLKRISSVLSALQLNRRDRNTTERSNVEPPANLTRVDIKHNNLIELSLKRFTKLKDLINSKRNLLNFNNGSSTGNINTYSHLTDVSSAEVSSTVSYSASVLEFLQAQKNKPTMSRIVSRTSILLSQELITPPSHMVVTTAIIQKSETPSLSVDASKLKSHSSDVEARRSVHHNPKQNKPHRTQRSKEFTYVTFRGGLEAGVFTERGRVQTMETCVEVCYNHSSCHVAFMVGNTCYSIQCYSQKTCEVLPVDTTVISTRVVYLKDRMLRLPYSITSHPTASSLVRESNFTIMNCAKNITVLKNMTFLAGMSAGNYTDYGTVDSIQACSNICCSKKVCDAAFMILNNCFTIDCISDKACHAIPSKSHQVNTSIVYFRETLSKKRFQLQPKKVSMMKDQRPCALGRGVLKSVTLNGGISAGNFTAHGIVDEFSSCVDKCCGSENCDVAFMIERNCYSVKCAENKRLCLPIVARTTKFKTIMALKNRAYFGNVTFPDTSELKCVQAGPTQYGLTFRRGIKAGNFTGHGKVKNMSRCIQHCCSSSCDAAFMIGKNCYSVACSSRKDCDTVVGKKVNFTTAIAFVNRAQNVTSEHASNDTDSNQINQFTKSIFGGHCDITDEQQNVNITGGWKAGKFLRLPDIKDMHKCTEACCNYHGCGAAMFIDQYCYNLICFKTRGCQFMGTKKAFMIDKFVAVHKNVGHILPPLKKAQITSLSSAREHVNHSIFMQDVLNSNKLRNQSTSLKTLVVPPKGGNTQTMSRNFIESHSIQPTRARFRTNSGGFRQTVSNLNKKKYEIPSRILPEHDGITLSSLWSRTISSTVTSPAASFYHSLNIVVSQTSSAISNRGNANSITPNLLSLHDTSIVSKPSATSISPKNWMTKQSFRHVTPWNISRGHFNASQFSSASSASSKNEGNVTTMPTERYSFLSDYSLLKERNNHNRKRSYACTHTFVFNNSTLRGGLNAGDVKNEGRVEGMEECVEMCCKTPECNVALLLNETCYIVACFNKRNCEAIPARDKDARSNTKVAYVARNKDETELIKQLISHKGTSKINDLNANSTENNKSEKEKDLPMTDVVVSQGSCIRSPILRDVRFKLGTHAGDFKSVGKVTSVDECVALCCKANVCNAIFMMGSRCHLVSCSNELDCQTVEAKSDFYKPTVVYLARNKAEVAYFLKMIPKELRDKYDGDAIVPVNATSDKDEQAIRRSQLERKENNGSIETSLSTTNNGNITTTTTMASQTSKVIPTVQDQSTSSGIINVSPNVSPALESNTFPFPVLQSIATSLSSVNVEATSNGSVETSYVFSAAKDLTPSFSSANIKQTSYKLETSSVFPTLRDITPSFGSVKVVTTSYPGLTSSNVFPALIEPTPMPKKVNNKETSNPTMEPSSNVFSNVGEQKKPLSSSNILTTMPHTFAPFSVLPAIVTSHLSGPHSPIYSSDVTSKTWKSYKITTKEAAVRQSSNTVNPSVGFKSQPRLTVTMKNSTGIISQPDEGAGRADTAHKTLLLGHSMSDIVESMDGFLTKISSSYPVSVNRSSVKWIRPAGNDLTEVKNTIQMKLNGASYWHRNLDSVSSVNVPFVTQSSRNVTSLPKTATRVIPSSSVTAANIKVSPSSVSNENVYLISKNSSLEHSLNFADSVLTMNKTPSIETIESKGSALFKEYKRGDIVPLKSSFSHEWIAPNSAVGSFFNSLHPSSSSSRRSVLGTSLLPSSSTSYNASREDAVRQFSMIRETANDNDSVAAATRSPLRRSPFIRVSPSTSKDNNKSSYVIRTHLTHLRDFTSTRATAMSIEEQSTAKKSLSQSVTPPIQVARTHGTLDMIRTTRTLSASPTVHEMKTTFVPVLTGLQSEPIATYFPPSYSYSVLTSTAHSSSRKSTSSLSFSGVNTLAITPTLATSLPRETNAIEDQPTSWENMKTASYELEVHTISTIKSRFSRPNTGTAKQVSSLPISSQLLASISLNTSEMKTKLSASLQLSALATAISSPKPTSTASHIRLSVAFTQHSNRKVRNSSEDNASAMLAPLVQTTSAPSSKERVPAVQTSTSLHLEPMKNLHVPLSTNATHKNSNLNPVEQELSMRLWKQKHHQTSSSLQKAKYLLQSLQENLLHIESKKQEIPIKDFPRNENLTESQKQRISRKQMVSRDSDESIHMNMIIKELSSSSPKTSLIQALNDSVQKVVSNASTAAADFKKMKLLLNDIRKIILREETSLLYELNPKGRTTTQIIPSSHSLFEKALYSWNVGTINTSAKRNSYIHTTSSFVISETIVHHNTASTLYPPSVTQTGFAAPPLEDFSNEQKGMTNLSSAEEKQKRVEIPEFTPFAGGLLEQIKVLRPPSISQHLSRDSTPDSTPISGALLEQIMPVRIRPVQEISPRPTSVANLTLLSSKLAASPVINVSISGRRALVNNQGKPGKAALSGNFRATVLTITTTENTITRSATQLTAKYLSAIPSTLRSKSQRHQRLSIVSDRKNISRTSLNLQTPAPSPKGNQVGRPSPQRTEPINTSKANPSFVVKSTVIIQSKISTPSVTNILVPSMPSVKHLESHSVGKESQIVINESSQTGKATGHYRAKELYTSAPDMTTHDAKADMFGYFAQLLKSIKDILTKKNTSSREISSPSSTAVDRNNTILSFKDITASVSQNLIPGNGRRVRLDSLSLSMFRNVMNTALPTTVIPRETLKESTITPLSTFGTPIKSSTLPQPLASKGLDMSLAMQPLHEIAFNITGLHKAALCKHSPVRVNSTLRGGIHAGILKEFGGVRSDTECISQCCLSKTCDAAFLLLDRCFLVTCKSKTLCENVPAKNLTFRPRVVYMQNKMALPTSQNSQTASRPFSSNMQQDSVLSSIKYEISTSRLFDNKSVKVSASKATPELERSMERPLCKASVTRQNETLRGGIKSGHFKDEGIVESLERCIELCCNRDNCSVALTLLNRCFSVSCYNESSCESIPARSLIFQPQLAYVRRNLNSHITSVTRFKTISKTLVSTDIFSSSSELARTENKNSLAHFHDNCRHGNLEKEVTLHGGLNAGLFIDNGVVTSIEQCVNHCCHATNCDMAFMIMKRCFLVTCYSSNLCETIPVRNVDYFTEVVRVLRDEAAVVRDLLARVVQPSSPSIPTRSDLESLATATQRLQNSRSSSSRNNQTRGFLGSRTSSKRLSQTSHFIGPHIKLRSPTVPPAVPAVEALIKSTIEPLSVNKHKDVGLIQTLGMSTRRKNTRHAPDKTITPSSVIVDSLLSSTERTENNGNVSLQGKELDAGGAFAENEKCQSTVIYYNATMQGGINAGVFKDQGTVQNMRKCIEQCCRWQFCSVAFMLLTRCYAIACYNDHLCNPVPARNLTFTPRIAVISRVQRDQGNFGHILENIVTRSPTMSSSEKTDLLTSMIGLNSSFLQTANGLFPSKVTTTALNQTSSLEIKPSPSHSLFPKVLTRQSELRHNCRDSEQKHNVTLRGGLNAGNFTDKGKVANIQQCIDFCCKEDHCDVALMLLENCFTVRCHKIYLCESVPAKTAKYRSRIVYVEKIRTVNSTRLFIHNTTNTISLLYAALPDMGESNESKNSQRENKPTISTVISGFNSEQLAELVSPSPSTARVNVLQRSGVLRAGNWSSVKRFANRSKDFKRTDQTKNALVSLNMSHSQHRVTPSTLTPSGYKTSLLSTPAINWKASSSAHHEPTTQEEIRSGSSSGLTKTLGDSSQHSLTHPSSCLNSPVSYNVTLRNGIRSGYFRDQGRVENMGECIHKCCDFDACDVAFMLRQRCYLVACYTKKGCQTVPARHSLFRPRVAHVHRTNISQLMSFMDEQETVEQPDSRTKADHVTPSSTLPAPVKSVEYSTKHSIKTNELLDSKKNMSQFHHNKDKHYKIKRKRVKDRSGHQAKDHKGQYVTVAPELKKRKSRKPKKNHQGNRQGIKLEHATFVSSKARKMQYFKNELERTKDQKLSHSDLEQLFRIMKPKTGVSGATSVPGNKKQDTNSESTKTKIKPDISRTQNVVTFSTDNPDTADIEYYAHNTSGIKSLLTNASRTLVTLAPKLNRKLSAATIASGTLPTAKKKSRNQRAQSIASRENNFKTQVEDFQKKGSDKELTSSKGVKTTETGSLKRKEKPTPKQRVTYSATKDFLGYVTSPTKTTPRLRISNIPTVNLLKRPPGHKHKFLSTKSTVPSLPTQAPDLEVSSCSTGEVEYNQTLRGGLSSGLFHEVGKVNDIRSCSQHCCSSPICDLVFMVLHHCFLVTCSSSNPHLCDSTPALATNFNPMISRVLRGGGEDVHTESAKQNSKPFPTVRPITTPTKPSSQRPEVPISQSPSVNPTHLPTTAVITTQTPPSGREGGSLHVTEAPVALQQSFPGCLSAITEQNVTLRGGLHAGKFTVAGKVNGSSACTELCCKANNCDVAFYAFNRCFLVNCFDEYLCGSTPSLLPNFNPTVVHVYRHHSKPTPKPVTTLPPINDVLQAIEDETQVKLTPDDSNNKTCSHSDVYEEVTLRMGYNAGNFTSHGKVNSSNQCVEFCCKQQGCDLIFMFLNNCFTVSCSSGYACEIVPARPSRFKPRVVYFIKNNSSTVIKPSEFNNSLSGHNLPGQQPVNMVHYKELRSNKKNSNSYKKDLNQMTNNTQTVDEEFVVIADNKITARNVIKSTKNSTLEASNHNVSNQSGSKTAGHSENNQLRKKHQKMEVQGSGVKRHQKSRAEEKMDIIIKKLSNVTEENEHLEGEIRVLMAKQNKRPHRKKVSSSGSGNSEDWKIKSNSPLKTIKRKGILHKVKERKSRLGHVDAGSSMDSNASKRVVLVDTDRPPVYPPTDEHNIEEHTIQTLYGKIRQKTHYVKAARKVLTKQLGLKKQHSYSKNKSEHRHPTNEHRVEERIIYVSGSTSGHANISSKHPGAGVRQGSENKYGQPEPDKDDLGLGEIMNLKPNMKTENKPEEPVWDSSGNNGDDMESFHESTSKDEFQIEKQIEPNKPRQKVRIGSRNRNKNGQGSFSEQIEEKGPKNHNEFANEKQNEPRKSSEQLRISLPNRKEDRTEGFHEQMAPTHESQEQFSMENKSEQNEPVEHFLIGSRNRSKQQMEGFHRQIEPTHESHFQLKNHRENENANEVEFQPKNQFHQKGPEEKILISAKNQKDDHMKSFLHEQTVPTQRPYFQKDLQRKKEYENEDEDNLKNQSNQHEPPLHEVAGSKPEGAYDKEGREMSAQTLANSSFKEPEPRFTMSKSEPVLSDFAQLGMNMEKSHREHSVKKPAKHQENHYAHSDKWNPNDGTEETTRVSDIKENEQTAVTETLEDTFASSFPHSERVAPSGPEQTMLPRRRPDLDAIYDKINYIYNRLQDLIEQQSQRGKNKTAEENDGTKYSRRHEERIPTPPMSSNKTTPTMSSAKGNPRKKIRVVKQYVTDHIEGSGMPSSHHKDVLMDYIKTIYSRVQELYKRKIKPPSTKQKNAHGRKKAHFVIYSGDGKKKKKSYRERTRSRLAKKHQRKNAKEEAVLKEMKQIYKNMKQMYHQERKAKKKSELMARKAERQRQRSFIPTSSSKARTKPSDLVSSLERVRPLSSSIAGAQNKPQVHRTGTYPPCIV